MHNGPAERGVTHGARVHGLAGSVVPLPQPASAADVQRQDGEEQTARRGQGQAQQRDAREEWAFRRGGTPGRLAADHLWILFKAQPFDHLGHAGIKQPLHDVVAGAVGAAKHAVAAGRGFRRR